MKSKLVKLLIIFAIGVSIFFSPFKTKAYEIPRYELKESSIIYKSDEVVKGRILIYHSHTSEEYVDGTVVDVGQNLAEKLELKGYEVIHIVEKFDSDYNSSYNNSRAYLEGLELSAYDLIIDLHRDSISGRRVVNLNEVDCSVGMFVLSRNSSNYNSTLEVSNGVSKYMDKFDEDLLRNNWT